MPCFAARLLACAASAWLLAASQPPSRTPWLAAFALAPWILATRGRPLAQALPLAALLAVAYGGLAARWVPDALRALGSSGAAPAMGLLMAALWAKAPLFVGLALVLERRDEGRAAALTIPCTVLFVLEHCVSKASWGVPLALLGHSQHATGVAQLAVTGGVPAVSALLLACNVSLARAFAEWSAPSWRVAAAAFGALGGLAALGAPVAEALRPAEEGPPVRLLLAQPDLPRVERWSPSAQTRHLRRAEALVAGASEGGVDLVVLPENLLTSPVDETPALRARLEALGARLEVPLLVGLVTRTAPGDRYRSAAVWIDPERGLGPRTPKGRGVPFVETEGPGLLRSAFGHAAAGRKLAQADPAQAGPLVAGLITSPLLCYEALFPSLAAKRRGGRSLAFVHLVDESWAPAEARRQLAATAAFRAIEQRLPLLRVGHGGLTRHVDAFGRTRAELPMNVAGTLRVTLRRSPPPTLLERVGPALLALASAGLAVLALASAGLAVLALASAGPGFSLVATALRLRRRSSPAHAPGRRAASGA